VCVCVCGGGVCNMLCGNFIMNLNIRIYIFNLSIYSCGPATYFSKIPPASMYNAVVHPVSTGAFPNLRTIDIKTRYTTCDVLKQLRSLFLHFSCYTDHSTSSKIVNLSPYIGQLLTVNALLLVLCYFHIFYASFYFSNLMVCYKKDR
jgi:hypothetical protein